MSLGDYCMGENLKKIRIERGMTQIALQMQTGIEQALISKYERESESRLRKRLLF